MVNHDLFLDDVALGRHYSLSKNGIQLRRSRDVFSLPPGFKFGRKWLHFKEAVHAYDKARTLGKSERESYQCALDIVEKLDVAVA